MAKIAVDATVVKLTRNANKDVAQITITVPSGSAGSIPMGQVRLELEATQKELFEGGQ